DDITKEAVNKTGTKGEDAALGDKGNCLVAVVLDNTVISDPQILSVLTSDSTIEGSFDAASATDLANKLNYGALPVTFTNAEVVHVTATLGATQLKAGLLAAGIGILVVAVSAVLFSRLL